MIEKEKLVVNFKEVISQPSSRCLALITGLIYDPSPGFLCLKELLWLHGDVKHTHTHTQNLQHVCQLRLTRAVVANKLSLHPCWPPSEFYCLPDCHLHSSIYGGRLGFYRHVSLLSWKL